MAPDCAASDIVQLDQGRARLRVNPNCGMITEFSWDIGGGERRHWLRPHAGEVVALNAACYPLVPYSNRIWMRNQRTSRTRERRYTCELAENRGFP